MHKYIALLRAINVGGHNVKMDILKSHFRALGFSGVETLLASGNVIFDSKETNRERIATQIAHYLEEQQGYPVATFIRTPSELAAVVDYEPFKPSEIANAAALGVAFLNRPLDENARTVLAEFETDIDKFHAHGCEAYWMCVIKQSDSKFSNAVFEKKLGITATFRGIKTIRRLAAKYAKQDNQMTDLKTKLQIKDGMCGSVVNLPKNVDLGFRAEAGNDYAIVFVSSVAEVAATGEQALGPLREDGVLWYCYPKKSSRIKTDINRDNGWSALSERGYRGVRAVSIDDVWTGLRFRERRFVKK